MTSRPTTSDSWGTPVRLGPTVNPGLQYDSDYPSISADGRVLFFASNLPGRIGEWDLWITRRATKDDDWGPPVNLGPKVNSAFNELWPQISPDGQTLYFSSERPGGLGGSNGNIWQAAIIPIVDLNSDGIVDASDMCIVLDHWGEDYPLCDVGPMPWGDGVVDVQDLIVLAEHLFEEIPPAEPVQ